VGHAKLKGRKIKTPSLNLDPDWVLRFSIIKIMFIMNITKIMKIMFVMNIMNIIKITFVMNVMKVIQNLSNKKGSV